MSFPFGGHPTLERFVEWVTNVEGCQAEIKVRNRASDGQPYKVLEIINPHGGCVSIVNPEMGERLAPSSVAYYQRRLGTKTPFAATPEHSKPPEEDA